MYSDSQINQATGIYNLLPNSTCSGNVMLSPVYGTRGVAFAKTLNGIFTLRVPNKDKHLGNPYSSVNALLSRDSSLIRTQNTKESVVMYIAWVLNSEDSRAIWIREVLSSGILKNRPLVYYKELDEPSHANALDYLISKWESI